MKNIYTEGIEERNSTEYKQDVVVQLEGKQGEIRMFNETSEEPSKEVSHIMETRSPIENERKSVLQRRIKSLDTGKLPDVATTSKFGQYMKEIEESTKKEKLEPIVNKNINQVLGLKNIPYERVMKQDINNAREIPLRRQSFFGNPNDPFKTDPLHKIIESQLISGRQSPKQHKRMVRVKSSKVIQRKTESTSTFQNELLQKTLKSVQQEEVMKSQGRRNIEKINQLSLGGFEQEKVTPVIESQNAQTERLKTSILNEVNVHQTVTLNLFNDYNIKSQKYTSSIVHLGVLLKNAISISEQGHNPPCYFLTQVSTHILDKLSFLIPQFASLLFPLKSALLQCIFSQFNFKKEKKVDQLEYYQQSQAVTKDLKISPKYMNYESFHDKLERVMKENKELRKQISSMQNDKTKDMKHKVVVRNLVCKFQRDKRRNRLQQVFNTFKFQALIKFQDLYIQLSKNTSFGVKAAQKMLMRRCYMSWTVYRIEQKLKKFQKEIQYYQSKYDEVEQQLVQTRGSLSQLSEDHTKLQNSINEKNNHLETRSKELAKVKVTTSSKKPEQVRKVLKLYFKYMFTNPYITRVRIQNDLKIPSITESRTEESFSSPQKLYNLRLLLKKKELLHEGGYGVQTLNSCSLNDIMIRWAQFMVERAQVKLNKIIDIIEKEVKLREFMKQQKKQGLFFANSSKDELGIDEESSSSDSEEDEIVKDERSPFSYDSDHSNQSKLQMYPSTQCFNIRGPGVIPGAKVQSKKKQYVPFKNFKRDLSLLKTFRQMISKVITELGVSMIDCGYLLAIIFSIDKTERKIMLSNSDYVQNVSQMATQRIPSQNKHQQRLSTIIMPFSLVTGEDSQKEEVTIQDYKHVLLYVNDRDPMKRSQMVLHEYERLLRTKLDWYFSTQDLVSGNHFIYTSLLGFVFYWNSCLDQPSYHGTVIMQREAQRLQQEQVEEETKHNWQILKKIHQGVKSKIQPLLQRRVYSNMHDVCLLYSSEEYLTYESSRSPLELVTSLPFMSSKELMVRWANHILRSYDQCKSVHELSLKFKEKFHNGDDTKKSKIVTQIQSRQTVALASGQLRSLSRIQSGKSRGPVIARGKSQIIKRGDGNFEALVIAVQDPKIEEELPKIEIKHLSGDLMMKNYEKLIILLAYISPETLWDMQEFDFLDIERLPHFVNVVEKFLENSNKDSRNLFIINAISRITKKHHLISISDLYQNEGSKMQHLLIELFLSRPYLSNPRVSTAFYDSLHEIEDFYSQSKSYLESFDKGAFDVLQVHIDKMKSQREPITQAFAFVQDAERVYNAIKERVLLKLIENPNPSVLVASHLKIHKRPHHFINQVEASILQVNRDWLFELVQLRQPFLNIQWSAKIDQTIKKFLYPLRRYMNAYLDDQGCLSYFDVWKAIKSLNIRTFNLDTRDVENIIIRVVKLKEKMHHSKQKTVSSAVKAEESIRYMNDDYLDQENEAFKKQLKNQIQTSLHKDGRASPDGKMKSKSSGGNQKGDNLDNLGLKSHYYKTKFTPSDFILILISILFKGAPGQFMRELIILNPSLKEEALKNVNRLLSKDKIGQHVEQYLVDFTPGISLESFIVQILFAKNDIAKNHPYTLSMKRHDFKKFLNGYLDSLYAIFDFYLTEYQSPLQNTSRYCILQPEAAYLLLQDLDAFNPETGLHKQSFRKILAYIQKHVSDEQQQQAIRQYEGIFNINSAMPTLTQSQSASNLKTKHHKQETLPQVKNKSKQSQPTNQEKSSQAITNYSEEGFSGLTFFEFIELLYITSQYHNPDPFINANQKFADFIEQVVFVHVQFKIKGRKNNDSIQKDHLIKTLSKQKIQRGVSLDTINSILQLC